MPAIEFSRTHSYLPAGDGILLPVFLNNGAERVKLLAHVDTGASHCLFDRRHAELLNLDVEAGDPMAFRTATGRVEAFGHLVTIETLGLNFESVVYFFADERINKNLLGRRQTPKSAYSLRCGFGRGQVVALGCYGAVQSQELLTQFGHPANSVLMNLARLAA
jgi:aspartyl protease